MQKETWFNSRFLTSVILTMHWLSSFFNQLDFYYVSQYNTVRLSHQYSAFIFIFLYMMLNTTLTPTMALKFCVKYGVQQAWNEFNMKSNKLLKMKECLSDNIRAYSATILCVSPSNHNNHIAVHWETETICLFYCNIDIAVLTLMNWHYEYWQ